jgi:acetolactate synthase-1/2/3 large subunit
MKLSDYVIDTLAAQGVRHIYELIGGMITHLLDSTFERADIRCISVRHEQAAAFAAEAEARCTGTIGVAMATSGPGATNLITGIGSCWFDSIPCLFITGQVNTYEQKNDSPVRQIGFQETDIVSIVRPITKHALMVREASRIRYELEKAIFLANHGRPGPVLLDLPMNIQRADIAPEALVRFIGSPEHAALIEASRPDLSRIDDIAMLLEKAERPVILAGGGVRLAGGADTLLRLADATGIPVAVTLMGLDALPHDHPSFVGMVGSYGNRFSNLAVANADLLIAVGTRLDTRITGTKPSTFARAATIVHVDIDPGELGATVNAAIRVRSDARAFLSALADRPAVNAPAIRRWHERIVVWMADYPTNPPADQAPSTHPNRFLDRLSGLAPDASNMTVDVGQNQMWAGQSYRLKKGQRALISGGMGAMGFALPAAIGAALATGNPVICIAGDGGFQINLQEMQTVVHYGLPIKMIVMNNHSLGMVRQFQELYFEDRYQSTVIGYSTPDFVKLAEVYGIPGMRITGDAPWEEEARRLLEVPGPCLIEINLPLKTSVDPKLVLNRPIEDMFPFFSREELARAMIIPPLDAE